MQATSSTLSAGLFVQLGGPSWTVQLGRRDATTASASLANSDLPGPNSNLNNLITAFSKKGLSTTDMVALAGNYKNYPVRYTRLASYIYGRCICTFIHVGFLVPL